VSENLLKTPNVRGDGVSTVERLPGANWSQAAGDVVRKLQRGYYCRPLWNFCRRTPLVLRERRALLGAARAGVRVPQVIAYRNRSDGSELITAFIHEALPLRCAVARYPEARDRILRNAGFEIGKLHRARWTHGALYSEHVLVCPDQSFNVSLIDLEKGRRSFRSRRDLARFLRHNDYLTAADLKTFRAAYASARRRDASTHPDAPQGEPDIPSR